MRSIQLVSIFAVVASVAYGQTVYLAGDSTMAKGGGGNGTDGQYYLTFDEKTSSPGLLL